MSKDQVREALEALVEMSVGEATPSRLDMIHWAAWHALSALAAAPEVERVRDHLFVPGDAACGWQRQCSVKVPVVEAERVVGACCGYPPEAHATLAPEPVAPVANPELTTPAPEVADDCAHCNRPDVPGYHRSDCPTEEDNAAPAPSKPSDATPPEEAVPFERRDLYSPAKQLAKRHLTAPSKVKMLADDIHGYAITLHVAHAEDIAAKDAELAKVREENARLLAEMRAQPNEAPNLLRINREAAQRAEAENATLRKRLEEAERGRDEARELASDMASLATEVFPLQREADASREEVRFLWQKAGLERKRRGERMAVAVLRLASAEQRISEARALIHDSPTSEVLMRLDSILAPAGESGGGEVANGNG